MSEALPDQVVWILCQWAERQPHILELWLFGSRAKGTHRPDSDVDIGLILTDYEGAYGAYVALADRQQLELSDATAYRIRLAAAKPGLEPGWSAITSGRRLWSRGDRYP